MTRIYISGPISGMPALNYPAFHTAAVRLRAFGYDVVSPTEICTDIAGNWAECMRRDIAALMTCDAVALLPGWRNSRGASLEVHIAEALGMSCRPVDAYLNCTPEALDSRQVLKAEAARPDATDCEIPANASPVGGPMGVEQPAAAGLAVGIAG